jgi:hypothetical protein
MPRGEHSQVGRYRMQFATLTKCKFLRLRSRDERLTSGNTEIDPNRLLPIIRVIGGNSTSLSAFEQLRRRGPFKATLTWLTP